MVEGTRGRASWWWGSGLIPLLGLVLLPVVTSLAAEELPAGGWWVWPAVAVLAVPLMLTEAARARRSRAAAGDESAHLTHTLFWLAEATERRWRAEAATRMLERPEPIALRWSATTRPVPAGRTDVRGGSLTDLAGRLLALPSRQLVVLGAPGAGKSTLALLLTLDLLERRHKDPALPVPVLLSASSWRPQAEHLLAWMARRLSEDHPGLAVHDTHHGHGGRDSVTRMITSGLVLPVLDGLDELPAPLHAVAIEGIDLATAGGVPFLLTCRAVEYERAVTGAGQALSGAAVVELRPVEAAAARAYLTGSAPMVAQRWQELLDHLDPGSPVWQALSTPLMVWLARTGYQDSAQDPTDDPAHDPAHDPAELADTARFPDVSKVEARLLDGYLPAVYGKAGKTQRRLGFLARDLTRRRGHDIAWWRLDHRSRTPWAFAFVTAFAAFYLSDSIGQGLEFLRDRQFEAAFVVTTAAVLVRLNTDRRVCWPARRGGPVRRCATTLLTGIGLGTALAAGIWLAALARLGDRVAGSPLEASVAIAATSLGVGVLVAVGGALAVPVGRRPHHVSPVSPRERLVTSALVGVGAGLLFGVLGDRALTMPIALAAAVVTAVAYGPLAALTAPPGDPRRITLRIRGRGRRLSRLLLRGAAFGAAIGAQAVLLAWMVAIAFEPVPAQLTEKGMLDMDFLIYTVKLGCLSGLAIGLLAAAAWALLDTAGSTEATGPAMLLRMDRWACLIAAALAGLCAPTALLLWQDTSPQPLDGVLVGAVAATAVALRFAWPRFALARLRLAVTGRLPLRLMAFLDDAHRRGVLRADGGVYQFRHSRLRDHLSAGA